MLMSTMTARAAIRELRTQSPKVRNLMVPRPKDYVERLRRHQPGPLSAAVAKALHEDNRGGR